jgi:hypothetical protein
MVKFRGLVLLAEEHHISLALEDLIEDSFGQITKLPKYKYATLTKPPRSKFY